MSVSLATTTPTTLPDLSVNGPPLFPAWIGAVIWISLFGAKADILFLMSDYQQ